MKRSARHWASLLPVLAGLLIAGCASNPPEDAAASGWAEVPKILARIKAPTFPDRDFDVTRYGAVGDGTIVNTHAFAAAINACAATGGGRVVIPPGKYLTGPIHLQSNVNLHVSEGATLLFSTTPADYLPIVYTRYEGVECMNLSPLIYAFEKTNIAVTGKGVLDGQAANENWYDWQFANLPRGTPLAERPRWKMSKMAEDGVPPELRIMGVAWHLRPSFIETYRCTNVLIEGITINRSPMWTIHPTLCTNVTVRGVNVESKGPNNDGCNPESCSDVLIEDCTFNTGDDCIALKSGRNSDGRRINRPIENVIVRNCTMKDGHGGVVMGSEITGGARNIFVENCRMDSRNLDRMIRIKTNAARGGVVENVYVRNITVGQVRESILIVDLYYEEGRAEMKFLPTVRNIFLSNITSEKSRYVVNARGYEESKVRNIRIENCSFSGVADGNRLEHIEDLWMQNVTINGQPVRPEPQSAGALPSTRTAGTRPATRASVGTD